MWYVVIHPRKRRAGPVQLGSHPSTWEPVHVTGEEGVFYGAHFPADKTLAAQLRQNVGRAVMPDERVTRIEAAPVAADPPVERARVSVTEPMYEIARRNGWTYNDCTGSGENDDPTEKGGRARNTGLTMVELTLTRPPADWPELLAAGRPPWESRDWTPPAPDWRPPAWRDAPPPSITDEDPDLKGASGNVPVVTDGDEPPPPPAGDDSESVSDDADPDADPEAGTPPADDADPDADPDADELSEDDLAGYPEEHAEAARKIVLDLRERRGGPDAKVPVQAANFLLKKAELPTVNTAQLRALLG